MKRFQKRTIVKWLALFLACLLFNGNLSLSLQEEGQEEHLAGLFRWAKMDYQAGKYREVLKTLRQMLSYYDEEPKEDGQKSKDMLLKGKIYLLMAATYEQLRRTQKARENYRLSVSLLKNRAIGIEGIDLSYLEEYQRIILNIQDQDIVKPGIIEKPTEKPVKKRISPLLIIAGAAVIGGIVAVLLLKKKRPTGIQVETDYDTRVLGIEWIRIPAGEFMMGDNFNEGGGHEQPVHAVYLDGYYISKYEVTFEQFDRYSEEMGLPRPTDGGWGRGNRPVINVHWGEANSFCDWLSEKTAKIIHLPSEAQWEKAARGTDQRRYPWGNSPPDCTKTNYHYCDNQTHPVGSHPAGVSPYNVHDMAGNVSEWCLDVFSRTFYTISPYNNPINRPASHEGVIYLVIRGGSWEDRWIRSAGRSLGTYYWGRLHITRTSRLSLGFRLVMESN